MAKRRRNRRPRPGFRRSSAQQAGPQHEPDLVLDVREMLGEDHPVALLGFVSSLLETVAPETADPVAPPRTESAHPSLDELVQSFTDIDLRELTALLVVVAELTPDEPLARRLRREVAARDHDLPVWLSGLGPLWIEGAAEATHVLGDGDNLMVAARTASGHSLTAVVYIDHNLGAVATDAFVVPAALDELQAQLTETSGHDPDVRTAGLDPADARARITEAIELWSVSHPRPGSDTWPASRPLVEWVVRHLPERGSGYDHPAWTDADRTQLAEQFFGSPLAHDHDEADRELFGSLLWFGCDHGPGDPLRWSPTAVEILLSDWLPRKVDADAELLARAPALLRSFIRFSHAERGIREQLTEETLAAVDAWEPDYQRAVRRARDTEPAVIRAGGKVDDPDEPAIAGMMLDRLAQDVGGAEVLAVLHDEPLPDEAFEWDVVPDDVRDRVADIVGLVDRCCDELLDVETRTACRRLLADVAAAEADVFRQGERADSTAAAVTWTVARSNDWLRPGRRTTTELLASFGISGSVSRRAVSLLQVAGVGPVSTYDRTLVSTRYLIASRRREIIRLRDRWQDVG